MRITIDIDVKNVEEVVQAHRGEWVKLLAGVLLSKDKKKQKVEKAVCEEIIKILETELPRGLKEELVDANIIFGIDSGEDENLYV